jgi:hypothetical protein
MFDRKNELELLRNLVEQLRELAPRCPKDVSAEMLQMANGLEESAVHVERLLIRQRVIRPKAR